MRRTLMAALLFVTAAAAAAPAVAADLGPTRPARLDAWRIIGPGGGGTMRRPAISPHDPKVVVLGCDMTGAYLTADGGASWRMFNLGSVPTAFAFDPSRPQTIYAGAEAVYRSDDSGRTWRMVLPDPAKSTVARAIGDHGDRVLFTDDPAYPGSGRSVTVHAIAVDEDDPARVFVAASAADSPVPGTPASPTLLLGSTDGGRTWARVTDLGTERVFALRAEGGAAAPRVRAVGETGVYEGAGSPGSTSRLRAEPASPPAPSDATRARESCSPTRPCRWPASRAGGAGGGRIGRARDRRGSRCPRTAVARGTPPMASLLDAVRDAGHGEEWGAAKGSRPSLGPIAVSARFPLVAYVGLRGIVLPGRGEAPFNGIAKTMDGGRTWSVVHAESDRPSANLAGSWIEPRAQEDGHSVWFDSPYDLAVAPNDPDVAYATDLFRTYRTMDGGKAWAQVNSERRGDDRWTTRGLDVTTTYGVQFDPHDAKRVFIPYTDIGLFRSEDGGETWTGSTTGDPQPVAQHDLLAGVRPRREGPRLGRLQRHPRPAAPQDVAPHRPRALPRRRRRLDRRGPALDALEPGHGGVRDHARPPRPAQPEGQPHALRGRVRPRRLQVDRQRPHLGAQERRPRRRPRNQPFAWRLTLAPDGALYLVVARRSERGRIGDGDDGALYRSTRRRRDLAADAAAPGHERPQRPHRRPADPKRLYLSAWGVTHPDSDTGGGIFLSTDAGATWRTVFTEAQHVYDVTVDPRDPKVLYACGFDQAAFRSTDRGETWTRIRGYNFKWGHRVIPDPADAAKIYVTTFGGSVWHGPAAGDPKATEDVVR